MNTAIHNLLNDPRFELVLRWLLGGVFAFASLHKIIDPAEFARIIYAYGVFPGAAINFLAIWLPWLELTAGVCLIMGVYPRSAGIIASVLLTAFMIAISINLIRGHEFDCGCFTHDTAGYSSSPGKWLVRDIFLFIAGLWVIGFHGRRKWCLVGQSPTARKA